MIRAQVIYVGRVQGVGFRATVVDAARWVGVSGWVRNEEDGSVLLVVEGEAAEVAGLLEEVGRRLGGFIRSAHRNDEKPRGEVGFEIRR